MSIAELAEEGLAVVAKMTPAPWTVEDALPHSDREAAAIYGPLRRIVGANLISPGLLFTGYAEADANAAGLEWAMKNLPALLAAASESATLRAENERLRDIIEGNLYACQKHAPNRRMLTASECDALPAEFVERMSAYWTAFPVALRQARALAVLAEMPRAGSPLLRTDDGGWALVYGETLPPYGEPCDLPAGMPERFVTVAPDPLSAIERAEQATKEGNDGN